LRVDIVLADREIDARQVAGGCDQRLLSDEFAFGPASKRL
jgi:hypothetical protein